MYDDNPVYALIGLCIVLTLSAVASTSVMASVYAIHWMYVNFN